MLNLWLGVSPFTVRVLSRVAVSKLQVKSLCLIKTMQISLETDKMLLFKLYDVLFNSILAAAIFYSILFCSVLSYPILSYLVLSCPVLFCSLFKKIVLAKCSCGNNNVWSDTYWSPVVCVGWIMLSDSTKGEWPPQVLCISTAHLIWLFLLFPCFPL